MVVGRARSKVTGTSFQARRSRFVLVGGVLRVMGGTLRGVAAVRVDPVPRHWRRGELAVFAFVKM